MQSSALSEPVVVYMYKYTWKVPKTFPLPNCLMVHALILWMCGVKENKQLLYVENWQWSSLSRVYFNWSVCTKELLLVRYISLMLPVKNPTCTVATLYMYSTYTVHSVWSDWLACVVCLGWFSLGTCPRLKKRKTRNKWDKIQRAESRQLLQLVPGLSW